MATVKVHVDAEKVADIVMDRLRASKADDSSEHWPESFRGRVEAAIASLPNTVHRTVVDTLAHDFGVRADRVVSYTFHRDSPVKATVLANEPKSSEQFGPGLLADLGIDPTAVREFEIDHRGVTITTPYGDEVTIPYRGAPESVWPEGDE